MEDCNGIIDMLYEANDQEGRINFNNKETDKLHIQCQKDYKALMRFINSEIPRGKKDKLIQFFKKFNESTEEFYEKNRKLYYKGGFSDGIQIMFESLPRNLQECED